MRHSSPQRRRTRFHRRRGEAHHQTPPGFLHIPAAQRPRGGHRPLRQRHDHPREPRLRRLLRNLHVLPLKSGVPAHLRPTRPARLRREEQAPSAPLPIRVGNRVVSTHSVHLGGDIRGG